MSFGGGHPYPRKHGGGPSRVQVLLDAIEQDRGDAYTTDWNSIVYVENMALARAIAGAWGTNERVSHLWNPDRCAPEILARWETIIATPKYAGDTLKARRERVKARMTMVALGLRGVLLGLLSDALGSVFVDIEYNAAGTVYTSADYMPWLGTIPGQYNPAIPWASGRAAIVLRLQSPTGMTNAAFYQAANRAMSLIDPYLPVWLDAYWYRAGASSTTALNGISAAGFALDEDNALDNELLDA